MFLNFWMFFICWMFFMCWMLFTGDVLNFFHRMYVFVVWIVLRSWILSTHLWLHMRSCWIHFQVELMSWCWVSKNLKNHSFLPVFYLETWITNVCVVALARLMSFASIYLFFLVFKFFFVFLHFTLRHA